jgi:hypothetical protein
MKFQLLTAVHAVSSLAPVASQFLIILIRSQEATLPSLCCLCKIVPSAIFRIEVYFSSINVAQCNGIINSDVFAISLNVSMETQLQ